MAIMPPDGMAIALENLPLPIVHLAGQPAEGINWLAQATQELETTQERWQRPKCIDCGDAVAVHA